MANLHIVGPVAPTSATLPADEASLSWSNQLSLVVYPISNESYIPGGCKIWSTITVNNSFSIANLTCCTELQGRIGQVPATKASSCKVGISEKPYGNSKVVPPIFTCPTTGCDHLSRQVKCTADKGGYPSAMLGAKWYVLPQQVAKKPPRSERTSSLANSWWFLKKNEGSA